MIRNSADFATRLICPLVAGDARQMRSDMAQAADRGADAVECRLDFLTAPPDAEQLAALLSSPPLEVIVTCRPAAEGGNFRGAEADRLELLNRAAACGADFIDVETNTPRDRRPNGKIICSHHDFQSVPAALDRIAASMDACEAAVNKIVFTAGGPEDALRALDLLRACKKPTIALAMGEAGVASRVLAKKFGAFGTFAALAAGAESAPGQPTLDVFKTLYRWDSIDPETAVYGVIGSPVAHSMSPAIHNAAFEAAGINAVYVPLRIEPGAENFSRFLDAVLARPWLNWRGLSVTIPHKENALAYLGAENCDEPARKIGAINTITISPDGSFRGDNTDNTAAVNALSAAMGTGPNVLAGRKVALLGAGGVGRAIAAAMARYKADVTIFNRTLSRAKKLAEEFDCHAAPLDAAAKTDAEIVINCTSVGMHPETDATPLSKIPPSAKVVFDTIYNPLDTYLLQQAKRAGCTTVSGLEMFVGQAAAQFEIWTAKPAPRNVMRKIVLDRLKKPHH
ncbi:MAG: shikimate dehydrogenase [Planctomycetota bacterium]|nr:shikimate dehydrogenase [Planctomycetota bacterium]